MTRRFNQDGLFSGGAQANQPELLYSVHGDVVLAAKLATDFRQRRGGLPQYPRVARQRGVAGDVVVNFVVEKSGNVSDLNIVSGPMLLRQAAISALRGWKYKPAQLDGQPIAVKMQATIRFICH
jgi:protein TonB